MAEGDMSRGDLEETLRTAPIAKVQPPSFIITNAIIGSYGISSTGDAYRALAVANEAIEALTKAGYEIVRPVCDIAPRTVYMGYACDEFKTSWRKGHGNRVVVVEAAVMNPAPYERPAQPDDRALLPECPS